MGDKVWIMERKLSSGFRRIFTVASDRLGNVNDCPTGIEPPTGARYNRKTTIKKPTKHATSFSFHVTKVLPHPERSYKIVQKKSKL